MDSSDDMNTLITLIGNFGFPIVVTLFLLFRFEKKIENLVVAITELKEVIKRWGD